jgi:hypothetical protein
MMKSQLPKTLKNPTEIDKAGKDGWELVSAVPLLQTHDGFTRTEKIFLIFKRPSQ